MIVRIGDEIDGVSIDTSAGGRLASWVMAGRERLLVGPAAGIAPPLGWGSYLMAPFVGRVRDGGLDWAGLKVRLRLNGGRHSIDGAVFDSEWTVTSRTAASVALSCPLDPNKWPFRGMVTQRIAIARGLMCLDAEIVAEEPCPPLWAGTRGSAIRAAISASGLRPKMCWRSSPISYPRVS